MSGRRSFSATVISRSNSENSSPSKAPSHTRKGSSIANALAGPGRPRRSVDSVFGNGNIANRRSSEGSSPFAKHGGKGNRTVEQFDSDANKENIAPLRLVSLATPSPVRRRPAKRFYSDSLTRSEFLSSTDNECPRIHVIKLASLDVKDSDSESKRSSPTAKKMKETITALPNPPRSTRTTTTTLEKNGKVLLRVERDADSSDSESSESESDLGSEDHYGRQSEDQLQCNVQRVAEDSIESHIPREKVKAIVVEDETSD